MTYVNAEKVKYFVVEYRTGVLLHSLMLAPYVVRKDWSKDVPRAVDRLASLEGINAKAIRVLIYAVPKDYEYRTVLVAEWTHVRGLERGDRQYQLNISSDPERVTRSYEHMEVW